MVQLMPLHPQTPSSLASFKSRLVLPFWYRLTQTVMEKMPLNRRCSQVMTSIISAYQIYSAKLLTHRLSTDVIVNVIVAMTTAAELEEHLVASDSREVELCVVERRRQRLDVLCSTTIHSPLTVQLHTTSCWSDERERPHSSTAHNKLLE